MDETKINRQLGTKWFTFYTKIRPWITCITTFAILIDFFQYIDLYTYFWWMLVYFIASITQAILSIVVFFKSKGKMIYCYLSFLVPCPQLYYR